MKRTLQTLLRVRRAERDAKALAYAAVRTKLEELGARRESAEAHVQRSAQALRSAGASGRSAGWWQPAQLGFVGQVERLVRLDEDFAHTERALAASEFDAQSAERALRGLERLGDRIAARERREHARAAQRRIEEFARGVRRSFAVFALACAALAAPARAKPPDAAVIPLIAELRARHAELDRRERALDDREAHARELERVASARMSEIEALAAAVEQRIEAWHAEQGDKSIGRLARIYAGMPPAKAGPLVERLELDLATRIVAKMKPQQSAALLPFLSPERALAMSWLVAHPLALQTGGPPESAEATP
jgi:flagellar export protein FliJ